MITFKSLSEIFVKEGISVFKIENVGQILQTGILMPEISEFIKLIKNADVKRVFIYEHFEQMEDYFITAEILEKEAKYEDNEFLTYILPQIDSYNEMISKLDFDYPSLVTAICFCDNNSFFLVFDNHRTLNGEDLVEPELMFKTICSLNENQREIIKKEMHEKVCNLLSELKVLILKDDKFRLCTNQSLRYSYLEKMYFKLDEKFEPLKEVLYRGKHSTLSVDGVNYIESIWREIKTK
jgi:hypothetical protein